MASRRTPESKPDPKPAAKPAAVKPAPATRAAAKRAAAPRAKRSEDAPPRPSVTPDVRRGMIAESAYLRAERRGFAPGHEDEDWLAAEAEVDQLLGADARAPQ